MVNRLVIQNVLHRPLRTLLSVLAVAVEITLILTVVGLSHGMLEESARRTRGVGADILVRPSTTQTALGMSSAELNEKLVDKFATIEGIQQATGTTVYMLTPSFQSITGINLEAFSRMCGGLKYSAGGPFEQPYDVVVDEIWARDNNLSVGQTMRLLNHPFRVTGIVETGKLSHIFIPIATMQDLLGIQGKVSQIYLKLNRSEDTAAAILRLRQMLPGYNIYSMEEFTSLLSINNIGGLRIFIRVIIGLAVTIGFLVVMLSMYTAILERTREIGILKSLGASPLYVVGIVIRETVLLALAGVAVGIGISFAAKTAIERYFPLLSVSLHQEWWLWAGIIAVAGAVLGATYPALRAARQDPIAALAYE